MRVLHVNDALFQWLRPEINIRHVWTSNLCPHFAAATQTASLTQQDFYTDQENLFHLERLTLTVLKALLGEDDFWSHGATDVFTLLQTILEKATSHTAKPGCTPACSRLEVVLDQTQIKFQTIKSQL